MRRRARIHKTIAEVFGRDWRSLEEARTDALLAVEARADAADSFASGSVEASPDA
jgi:hypothetical protein